MQKRIQMKGQRFILNELLHGQFDKDYGNGSRLVRRKFSGDVEDEQELNGNEDDGLDIDPEEDGD